MSVIGNFLFIFFFTSLAFVYKRESRHSPSPVCARAHSTTCQSLRVCSLTLMDVSFSSFLKKVKQEKLGGIWHASTRSFILPSYLMSKWF